MYDAETSHEKATSSDAMRTSDVRVETVSEAGVFSGGRTALEGCSPWATRLAVHIRACLLDFHRAS